MTTQDNIRKIVLAASAEADQPHVATVAAQIARETGADVAVVSADDLQTERLATLPRSQYVERASAAATAAVERLQEAGVRATKTVRSGPALDQILAFADEQDADLIVVGASSRGRLAARLLGDVPLSLVQRSRRPVLVVTDPGDAA